MTWGLCGPDEDSAHPSKSRRIFSPIRSCSGSGNGDGSEMFGFDPSMFGGGEG